MSSFRTLKKLIEKKSGQESTELIDLLKQNPALFNEVNKSNDDILMHAIKIGQAQLALDLLKVMGDLKVDNRIHRNKYKQNVLQLAIKKQMDLVAKQILLLNNTFSLNLIEQSDVFDLLCLLSSNKKEINSSSDYKHIELKLFFVFMTSYILKMRNRVNSNDDYSVFETTFVTLFPSITAIFPVFDMSVMSIIIECIDEPLDFALLEALSASFSSGHNLNRDITSKEKTTLLLCATVYNDKNLIDYIADLPCVNNTFFNQCAQEKIAIRPDMPIELSIQYQFSEIRALFSNPSLCLDLLQTLDNQLKNHYQSLGIELPQVNKNTLLSTGLLFWPKPDEWKGPKTLGVLNQLLLQKERKYGINSHPYAPAFFVAHVPPREGNKFVGELNLFKEFKKASPPLHGMEIHRLQWHLIMLAIERGGIFDSITPENIPELLRASVHMYNGELIFWPTIFDNFPKKDMVHAIGSSCPHYLHSLVLLSNLDYLAACFFEKYSKSFTFLAKEAGHTSSVSEFLMCDLLRGASFTPEPTPSQLPTHYYSDEQLEFYSNQLSASESQSSQLYGIFYKKLIKPLSNDDNTKTNLSAHSS